MRKYNGAAFWPQSTQAGTLPDGAEIETAIPARPAGLVADLLVPLGQAMVTGALLGGLLVFVIGEVAPGFGGDLFKVWAITALAITAGAWLILLGQTRRLLWAVEKLTGQDLDQNGVIGKPQERLIIVNAAQGQVEAAQRENAQRASEFARFVARLPVMGTSQRTWESELGRLTYTEFRDALIRLGWARWLSVKPDGTPNERRGWELTVSAAEILERISG